MIKILDTLLFISYCMVIVGLFTGLAWEFFIPGSFGMVIFTITLLVVSYRQPKSNI